ncbi:hypothetical protein FKM82_026540 [Ascaphus truei]
MWSDSLLHIICFFNIVGEAVGSKAIGRCDCMCQVCNSSPSPPLQYFCFVFARRVKLFLITRVNDRKCYLVCLVFICRHRRLFYYFF